MSCICETDRLCIRNWKAKDRKLFGQMNADPLVMEYFLKTLTEEESNQFVDRIEKGIETKGYGLWAVERKDTEQFIGFIGFNDTEFESDFCPCVEIGWRLTRSAWGKGLATEGARMCLEYGFNQFEFPEVYSFTAKANVRSERVMEKIGMRKVKEFSHPKIEQTNPLSLHVLYKAEINDYKKS